MNESRTMKYNERSKYTTDVYEYTTIQRMKLENHYQEMLCSNLSICIPAKFIRKSIKLLNKNPVFQSFLTLFFQVII